MATRQENEQQTQTSQESEPQPVRRVELYLDEVAQYAKENELTLLEIRDPKGNVIWRRKG